MDYIIIIIQHHPPAALRARLDHLAAENRRERDVQPPLGRLPGRVRGDQSDDRLLARPQVRQRADGGGTWRSWVVETARRDAGAGNKSVV